MTGRLTLRSDSLVMRLAGAGVLAIAAALWLRYDFTAADLERSWLVAIAALVAATVGIVLPATVGLSLVFLGGLASAFGVLALPFLALFADFSDRDVALTWTDVLLWASLAGCTVLAGILFLEGSRPR